MKVNNFNTNMCMKIYLNMVKTLVSLLKKNYDIMDKQEA